MEHRGAGPARSGRGTAVLLLAIAGVWAASRAASSGDLWVALGCGRQILESGFTRTDPFSFTSLPGHWINQNWGSHVLFTALHRLGGLPLLVLWKVATVLALTFLTAAAARRLGASGSLAAAAGIAAAAVCRPFLDVRPNLHTLLLAAVLIHWLARFERRRLRSLAPLLPLAVLWANLHGGFLFGILAAGAAGGSALLASRLVRSVRFDPWTAGLLPVLFLGAALVSPLGITNLTHPYEVSFGPDAKHWRAVAEWLPPHGAGALSDPGVRAFWILLAIGAAILAGRFLRRPSRSIAPSAAPVGGVALLALLLALTSRRFVPLFALSAIPLLAALAGGLLRRPHRLPTASGRIAALAIACAALADVTVRLIVPNPLWPASQGWASRIVRADEQPAGAVDFVLESRLRGRVLNDWTWGGYLLHRVPFSLGRPLYRIFIDGRAQAAYPAEASRDWDALNAAALRRDAGSVAAFLDYYRIDFCLLDRRGTGLASLVPDLPGWVGLYGDDRSVVAARGEEASRIVTRGFRDPAIAEASAALHLRTRGGLTIEERLAAFGHAASSLEIRPTTVGATELARIALEADEPLRSRLLSRAAMICDRLLEEKIDAPTSHERATIEANLAQTRAVIARALGEEERSAALRERARAASQRAGRYVGWLLR